MSPNARSVSMDTKTIFSYFKAFISAVYDNYIEMNDNTLCSVAWSLYYG